MKKTVVAFVLAGLASAVFAQQPLKPEEMIKYRKAGYSFMSWNMGKIKANLDGTFNKEQVIAAANVIAGTANSGMGALFGPGTEKEVGGEKTRVKPEFFQQSEKVRELAMAFNKEANELAKAYTMTLGKVYSIQYNTTTPQRPMVMGKMMMAEAAPADSYIADDIRFSDNVSVVFNLE